MKRIVDLFCGAGGESTGIMRALDAAGERYDLAAVNHWDIAMQTHRHNHPGARHFVADLNHLNPHEVFGPRDHVDLLWASPECTHHSVARGGRPRSDQSRASAFLILKWLSEFYVRRVIMENVPEFVTWGPLGSDGKPLKSKRGATFNAFVNALKSLGYRVDYQVLCAANYGDPTTRRRFFLQAVRGREKISWPDPTHAQTPGLFGESPWIPAREVIDWSIQGESIFARKRPLAPATMRRIEAGIKRYWGTWAEPFLVLLRGTSTARSTGDPLPTVTAGGTHFGLVEGTAALDITFRMLQPHELAAAQGFPADYWFAGNKTEKVKQIGNAVPVNTACALARAALVA